MRWQKVLQKQIMYFLSQWYRSRLAWQMKKIQKKLQDTSVHIWQQMSFLLQMSLYFHHTDGAAQPIS